VTGSSSTLSTYALSALSIAISVVSEDSTWYLKERFSISSLLADSLAKRSKDCFATTLKRSDVSLERKVQSDERISFNSSLACVRGSSGLERVKWRSWKWVSLAIPERKNCWEL
jgi:hypothetical protein